ncbi:MAG TPA: hypothetical protein VES42_04725 [Pilimelia sp.]|nr:hypothetical protein [Pilimelia sp.]
MGEPSTALRRIVLFADPAGTTISTSGGTRAALPGEVHDFGALAAALTRHADVPAEVRGDLDDAAGLADPGTAVVVHASQLHRLRTPETGAAAVTAVVGVRRADVVSVLGRRGVVAAVEEHQYRKWQTGGAADAALYCRLDRLPRLRRTAAVTPLDGGLGRVRIAGGDLPGLLADYLAASG